jgi:iron complex transport system substrate-binding protein
MMPGRAALCILLVCCISFAAAAQEEAAYPVTVESCGVSTTYEAAPERVLTFDTSFLEIMLELGLRESIIGVWPNPQDRIAEEYAELVTDVAVISEESWPPPGLETILSFDPDFVYGGYGYVFSEESGVTPESLAEAGVNSYSLIESCIGAEAGMIDPSMETIYTDIRRIGAIFGVSERAVEIIAEMEANVEAVQAQLGEIEAPLRVFYFGGGDAAPFTTGRYGMPTALIGAAGGENILIAVEDDWTEVSWETVITADPEVIILETSSWATAEDRIAELMAVPALADVTAIREQRFVELPYLMAIPSLRNDESVAQLAEAFYPDRFE